MTGTHLGVPVFSCIFMSFCISKKWLKIKAIFEEGGVDKI
jgi:hypothetical protein